MLVFKKVLCLLILLICFNIKGQENYFEGVITYDNLLIDKTGKMNPNQTKKYIGDKQVYYIDKGKYKSVLNGLLEITQYYTGKDTVYTKMKNVNTLMYTNTKENKEKIISSSIEKDITKINKFNCHVLKIRTSEGYVNYYFNDSIKIDYKLFEGHRYGLWYYCLKKTNGALPLKWVTVNSQIDLTITANEILRKELDEQIFNLPKGLPLVKSPE